MSNILSHPQWLKRSSKVESFPEIRTLEFLGTLEMFLVGCVVHSWFTSTCGLSFFFVFLFLRDVVFLKPTCQSFTRIDFAIKGKHYFCFTYIARYKTILMKGRSLYLSTFFSLFIWYVYCIFFFFFFLFSRTKEWTRFDIFKVIEGLKFFNRFLSLVFFVLDNGGEGGGNKQRIKTEKKVCVYYKV